MCAAPRFVDDERGGDGGVQGFDGRLHRNRDALVGVATSDGDRPVTLAADKDRRWQPVDRLEDRSAARADGREDAAAVPPCVGDRVIGSRRTHHRQAQRAAHGPAQRLPAERIGGGSPAAITPVAPAASATRTIAPRLPGSCTSMAMTTSGRAGRRGVGLDGRALGERDDRARRADGADGVHHRGGNAMRRRPATECVDERRDFRRAVARRGATAARQVTRRRARRRRDARRRAAAVVGVAARGGAETRDERILTAGDGLTAVPSKDSTVVR